ncbi:MAG TPA: YicC/YloC family endoribonuclease [Bacteroidales bacterium]|jgi:uncharacterized protein (TIGR00255 family)|nr:YicC/YloC family endoribonuclease [Bacteroidales bacterium]|tara:strand:+ start:2524 stop:3399 length:876 start_codon:yes stop_codon:yes gene_type:complete
MIKSMTGYGKHVAQEENRIISVEIRTLNSKQLDINLRTPQLLKHKEIEIRKSIGSILQRGKIDVNIAFEQNSAESASVIDLNMANHYYNEMKSFAESIDQTNFSDYLSLIMKMPDVIVQKDSDINEDELELVFECLSKALLAVDKFRITEGAFLEKDMALRINNILNLLTEVDKYEKQRAVNIKQRIKTNLSNFMQDPVTDNNRLEQEMIYYIEKLDITEEKLRLKNNCDYFLENINNVESSGKKLGFIVQEIGREINTLGSKANDSSLQRVVVLMKDELEKIKEQLFNIL